MWPTLSETLELRPIDGHQPPAIESNWCSGHAHARLEALGTSIAGHDYPDTATRTTASKFGWSLSTKKLRNNESVMAVVEKTGEPAVRYSQVNLPAPELERRRKRIVMILADILRGANLGGEG